MLECPGCGGNITFQIESQLMFCKYCDSYYDPYAIHKETDAERVDYFETKVFTCPQCGGEVLGNHNEAATFCTYCGSSTILSERISKEECPDYIIPFKKTKEDCKEAYRKAMKKAIFVPKAYKSEEFIEGFRGIYMPYWNYEFKMDGKVHLTATEEIQDDDYVLKNIFQVKGDLDDTFRGDAYDASLNFYDDISTGLAPFDFHSHKPFSPSFLSGFYAECADVSKEVYLGDAMQLAQEATMDKIRNNYELVPYKVAERPDGEMPFCTTLVKAARTLYPVWFMSYRNGDKVAYAAVNGQTGKVAADMPVDKKKYVGYSLLLAIPLFLILSVSIFFTAIGCEWFYQGIEDFRYVTIRSLCTRVLGVVLLFIFVKDKTDIYWYALYLVFGVLGGNIFNFLRLRRYKIFSNIKIKDLHPFHHLRPALHVFALNLIISIYIQLNTVMLGFLSTETAVGLFTASSKLSHVMLGIGGALGNVMIPRMSNLVGENNEKEFKQLSEVSMKFIVMVSLPICVGLTILAPSLIQMFCGETYYNAVLGLQILSPIVLAIGMSNVMGYQILYPLGKINIVMLTTGIGAFVNLLLNFILIPKYAQNGAAVATTIAEIAVTICMLCVGRNYFYFNLKN